MPGKPAVILAELHAAGISCEPHELGLVLHAKDPVMYVRALHDAAHQGAPPSISAARPRCMGYANGCVCCDCSTRAGLAPAMGTSELPVCTDDPMCCGCPVHRLERVQAVRVGARGAGPAAFAVKTARSAA